MLTISYQLTYYSVCLNSFHNAFYLFWKSLPRFRRETGLRYPIIVTDIKKSIYFRRSSKSSDLSFSFPRMSLFRSHTAMTDVTKVKCILY